MDIKTLATPLYSAKFWLKFVAVLSIIYGALCVLTIIGILVAWLPIWMGVLLFQAAGQIEQAYLADDAQAMHNAQAKLRTFFTIMGVLALIGIIVMVITFLFGLTAGLAGMQQMQTL